MQFNLRALFIVCHLLLVVFVIYLIVGTKEVLEHTRLRVFGEYTFRVCSWTGSARD